MAELRLADMSDDDLKDIDYEASAIKSLQLADQYKHNKAEQTLFFQSAQVFATLHLAECTKQAGWSTDGNLTKVWQALEDLVARP